MLWGMWGLEWRTALMLWAKEWKMPASGRDRETWDEGY
jgi:hypothetical protein